MLVHRRVTPSSISLVPIYTPGWGETKWNKVHCLRKQRDGRGWSPGPPDPEFEGFTTRPHSLPQSAKILRTKNICKPQEDWDGQPKYCSKKAIHVVIIFKPIDARKFGYDVSVRPPIRPYRLWESELKNSVE